MEHLSSLIQLDRVAFNDNPGGEEFANLVPSFDIEFGDAEWESEDDLRYYDLSDVAAPEFSAFVDGTQRTVMVGRFKGKTFSRVPLHAFEVVAGYIWRTEKRVQAGGWIKLSGIIGPFAAALNEEDIDEKIAYLLRNKIGEAVGTLKTLGEGILAPLEKTGPRWFVIDSSYIGIGGKQRGDRYLQSEDLVDEAKVRRAALAKVSNLRQYAEMLAHLPLRAFTGEGKIAQHLPKDLMATFTLAEVPVEHPWVLTDGPLFFTKRRRKLIADSLSVSATILDRLLIGRTIGYVKSHRLRPEHIEYVLSTPPGKSTSAIRHTKYEPPDRYAPPDALDPDDRRYSLSVYSTYVTMRSRQELHRAGMRGSGLVRLQFGIPVMDALGITNPSEAARSVAAAVYRERTPMPPYRFQPLAMTILEQYVKGKLTHPDRIRHRVQRWFV